MNFYNRLGIRQKFQTIMGISFFFIGIFLFLYFPLKQKSEMTEALHTNAKVIAQMIAKTSAAGLVFDDASSIATQFEALKEMGDVDFAVVLKTDGSNFSVYNENKLTENSETIKQLIGSKTNSFDDDKLAVETFPVNSDGQLVGNVVVGMNKIKIDDVVSGGRITALIISLVIFVLGLGAMRLFFNKVIYRPIKNLTSIADKLALGDVEININSISNDEIGKLEKSFNDIIESIKQQSEIAEFIANGNLNKNAVVKSENDILAKSINKVVETLRELINEVGSIRESTSEGDLEKKANADKFMGGYKDILKGFNDTIYEIISRVRQAEEIMTALSQGDLTRRMEGDYKGNYKKLQDIVNNLGESLSGIINDVSEAIEATASASHQISSSAEEMAAGSQEQSAQTTEVASAVEEMTSTILSTTKNASSAADYSKKAGSAAKNGGVVVKQTVEGMNKIAQVVGDAASTVKELGKSSNQIGEIIQVIDDIADQTNLLALNAAIEAARAGEQGRGFAVVADEVRKLAERTTKATKEIATMIKQIQKDTGIAVESIESGTKEVDSGKELANKAISALDEIIVSTNDTIDVINQVAAASEEQSSAAEQISKSIESISNVTNESASGIQQIAKASEDLSMLTNNLQNLISKFKIDTNDRYKDRSFNKQLGVNPSGKLIGS